MRNAIVNLLEAIQLTFCKLARIQFEAPWNAVGRSGC